MLPESKFQRALRSTYLVRYPTEQVGLPDCVYAIRALEDPEISPEQAEQLRKAIANKGKVLYWIDSELTTVINEETGEVGYHTTDPDSPTTYGYENVADMAEAIEQSKTYIENLKRIIAKLLPKKQ